MKKEFKTIIYKDFMRYGDILKCDDFIFEEDNVYITMKIAELNGTRMLFIICNGELISMEDLKEGVKW